MKAKKTLTKRFQKSFRNFTRSAMQSEPSVRVLSWLAVGYLKLVIKTNRFIVEPADAVEKVTPDLPVIVGVWHGQHILLPAVPIGLHGSAMISKSVDGEVTARLVEHFGNKTIRASGGRKASATLKKGGLSGFLEMLGALERKENVVQTADIPKGISRKAGLGIVQLAKKSGAPIVPLAIASSRRFIFKNAWDKAALNMPFGTTGICIGKLVRVSPNADDTALEQARLTLETELNQATARAHELAGNRE